MKTNSGFFDSVEGDKVYGAGDFTKVISDVVADGVSTRIEDGLAVSGGSTQYSFMVEPGLAYVNGHWFELSEDAFLTVQSSARKTVYVAVVEGSRDLSLETYEEGNEPSTAYLNIAKGVVAANGISISNTDIEDLRTFVTSGKLVQNYTDYSLYKLSQLKIARFLTDVVVTDWSTDTGHFDIPLPASMADELIDTRLSGTPIWKKPTVVFATGTGITSGGSSIEVHLGFSGFDSSSKLRFRAKAFETASVTQGHIGMLIVQFG